MNFKQCSKCGGTGFQMWSLWYRVWSRVWRA